MVTKLYNKFLKRIIVFSLVIITILNVFSPYRVYASSYDDLRNLVEKIEEDPELASTFWTSMSTSDLPRPSKEIYGDEYIDAMTKWIAVSLIPDIERNQNEDLMNALLNSEPFLEENMPESVISEEQYQTGLDSVNKAYEEYNKTLEDGGSKDDALGNGGSSLTDDITDKVEQDVVDGMSKGADIWDGGNALDTFGGVLFNALFAIVAAIFDAINAVLQSVMYKGEDMNGPIGTIATVVSSAFNIMTTDSSDAEFDSVGANSSISVRIEHGIWEFKYPHIHYSCEEIFSGKVGILGIDFISGEGQTEGLASVRKVIASWYKTLRLIAIVGFLSILIYTGIRIMLSSTAEDKAKYKEWIINWFIGLGILFCMHYIMSFIITVIQQFNEGLSNTMQYIQVSSTVTGIGGNISGTFNTNLIGLVRFCIQSDVSIFKLGYLIIYVMLTTYTLKFTFVYLKRVINMAFLTLIAPIVAFTYPLDKLSDGNAQGFSMWIKEYVFNALLQPMHFILYYILVGSSVVIAAENPIYAIAVLAFMSEGERLLRKIFGFDKASGGTVKGMQDAFAAAAIATSLRGLMNRGGRNGSNSSQGRVNFPGATNKDYKTGITMNENINPGNVLIGDSGGNGSPGGPGAGGSGSGGSGGAGDSGGGNGTGGSGNGGSGGPGAGSLTGGAGTNVDASSVNNIGANAALVGAGASAQGLTGNSPQHRQGNQPLSIRQKAFRGVKAVGKRAVRPIWDFDRTGKYNKKRFVRRIARGIVGAGVGITAAAVQAGISLTDGKYNPAEGVAAFAAGYGLAGRRVDGIADTFEEGYNDGLTKEEKMSAYQEDFRNRDDVIQFCKDNYGDEWKEYRDRMADNYVPRGFTDLKEMKEMIKYSNAISGDTKNLTDSQKKELLGKNDISAMSIKNVQRRKQAENSLGTVYDRDKENTYITAKTQGLSPAEAEEKAKQYRGEDAAIRYYNSIVKD